MSSGKSTTGNFFEDFRLGQVIAHPTPRTITSGDVALYTALYGSRFAVQSSDALARAIGYPRAPVDDLLVFHVVFGKTVPDISLNAIANLGYAECRFLKAVYPGDTLNARSEVIGVRQNSSGDSGIVYVRTAGLDQHGGTVLEYVRWVMVRKRDNASPAPEPVVPKLTERVDPATLGAAVPLMPAGTYDRALAGSPHTFKDYAPGEIIGHIDGMTIEETEHQLATRLYQNTAKVHFNAHTEASGRFGKRLVYGGVVMSLARALSFNGLGNAFHIAAINGGRHAAPCFAGDTIYASTEIVERHALPERTDLGALRVRLTATRQPPADAGALAKASLVETVLELDAWLLLPRIM